MIARLAPRRRRVGIAPDRRARGVGDGGVRGHVPLPEPSFDDLLRSAVREQRHGPPRYVKPGLGPLDRYGPPPTCDVDTRLRDEVARRRDNPPEHVVLPAEVVRYLQAATRGM